MTIPTTVIPDVPENTLDPAAGLNLALNPLRVLVQAVVSAIGVDAPPMSPADGECVIVGAGTGDFTGEDNNLARYVDEGAFWEFYEAGSAVWIVLNLDDMGLYAFNPSTPAWQLAGGSGGANAADLGMFFPGNPGSAQLLFKFVAIREMEFPADFAGSVGHIGTNPTSTFTMIVSVDGSTAGEIEVGTGGVFSFETTGNVAIPVDIGDVIEISAPGTTDGTAADIAATLMANLV